MNIIAYQICVYFLLSLVTMLRHSDRLRSRSDWSVQIIPTLFVDPGFFTSHCRRILYPGSVYSHLSSLYIYTILCKIDYFSGTSRHWPWHQHFPSSRTASGAGLLRHFIGRYPSSELTSQPFCSSGGSLCITEM